MIKVHLSRIMGDRKMSRADLARATNIRGNTVSQLYNEYAESIKFQHLDLICDALECKPHELFEHVPDTPHPVQKSKQKKKD